MPNPEHPKDSTWWRSLQKPMAVFVHCTAIHTIMPTERLVIYVEQLPTGEMGPPKAYPLKLWYCRYAPLPPEQIPASAPETTGG